MTGGVMPRGADTVVMQERAQAEGGQVSFRRRAEEGTERARGGRRPEARRSRAPKRAAPCGRRNWASSPRSASARSPSTARFASRSSPPATSCVDRHAARRRPDLRQQPLHAARHAHAPRLRSARHGRGARRSDSCSSAPSAKRPRIARRGDHQRRRLGGRGRLREATARQAGRSGVLENRHETRAPARLRQASAARISSACRATRSR